MLFIIGDLYDVMCKLLKRNFYQDIIIVVFVVAVVDDAQCIDSILRLKINIRNCHRTYMVRYSHEHMAFSLITLFLATTMLRLNQFF